MSRFVPRLTIPDPTDLNWIKTTYGGYNYCILGNPSYATGSALANCVGYAWGRWRELLGAYHNLSRGDAGTWYGNTSDGYQRSTTTPKLGSVVCWENVTGGAGHVAIVEEITYDSNGVAQECVISESVYGGTFFRTYTIRRSNNWYRFDDHKFQGFIWIPIEWDDGKQFIPLRQRRHKTIIKMR